jgi:hypothetical protein
MKETQMTQRVESDAAAEAARLRAILDRIHGMLVVPFVWSSETIEWVAAELAKHGWVCPTEALCAPDEVDDDGELIEGEEYDDIAEVPAEVLARYRPPVDNLTGSGGLPTAEDTGCGHHDPSHSGDLRRTIELLGAYGEAKFGDEWWPGEPTAWLPADEAAELIGLLG